MIPKSALAVFVLCVARVCGESVQGPGRVQAESPENVTRIGKTWYEWCNCGKGLGSVQIWPDNDESQSVTVSMGEDDRHLAHTWIQFRSSARRVSFLCDSGSGQMLTAAMRANQTKLLTMRVDAGQWVSFNFYREKKEGLLGTCKRDSGRLQFNVWSQTDYVSSVPFVTGTEGYACFKIPALLSTQAGSLLAFAEARTPDCDDFARTDTVYKRSTDGGRTWSSLMKLVSDNSATGVCDNGLVIGNIAPVQLGANSKRHPGRILVPYTRNNFRHHIVHSDDDGLTFVGDRELTNTTVTDASPDCDRGMSYFGLDIDSIRLNNLGDISKWLGELCRRGDPFHDPQWSEKLSGSWQFLGLGPPGGLQLQTGRVLVPGYHSYIRGLSAGSGTLPISQLYNNLARGHTLLSDDDGDTWRLGTEHPVGNGFDENQLVELADGSVLANSRSLSTGSPQYRVQALSRDGGETFEPSTLVPEIPEPFNGCQGSTVGPGGPSDTVYMANPDPAPAASAVNTFTKALGCDVNVTGRTRVSVWRSADGGQTYPDKQLVDGGLSAQTSLQFLNGKLMMMYEQADYEANATSGDVLLNLLIQNLKVLLPSRMIVREIPLKGFELEDVIAFV